MDCRFAPGPMARAFSEAMGHKERTIALYIKYRVEQLQLAQEVFDLARQQDKEARAEAERQAIDTALKKQQEHDDAELKERSWCATFNITLCPNCAFYGEMHSSWFAPANHILFSQACKCPKCKHRFDWYFHKMPALPNQ